MPWPTQEHTRGEFTVSTDRDRLDRAAIHRFLSTDTDWARDIPREVVDRSIDHSLCFGLYYRDGQIGFARVVTDYATFGYLADVYVDDPHRGRGHATWLLECILAHPAVRGLRRFNLVTKDAHRLYRRFGFGGLATPDRHMERVRPITYTPDAVAAGGAAASPAVDNGTEP